MDLCGKHFKANGYIFWLNRPSEKYAFQIGPWIPKRDLKKHMLKITAGPKTVSKMEVSK